MVVRILALTKCGSWPCTTESQEEKRPGTVLREVTMISQRSYCWIGLGPKTRTCVVSDRLWRAAGHCETIFLVQSLEGVSVTHTCCEETCPLTAPGLGFLLWASLQPGLLPRALLQFLGLCSWGFFSWEIFVFSPLMHSLFFHSRYSSKPCDLAPDETRVWIRWILVSGRVACCSEQSGQFAACSHHSQPDQQGRARYEAW